MRLEPFQLERYFGQYEFSVPFPLAASDCDGLSLAELLSLADAPTRNLWETLELGYTETQGHPLLREAIAGLYEGCEPDQVLVAAPEELIFIAAHCLVHNGDHVVCTFPGYQSLYSVAESLHAEVSRWEPDEADGWRFDPDRLAQLIRPSTRLIIVNFPHNPTGSLPGFDDYERMLEIAASHGIAVFSDGGMVAWDDHEEEPLLAMSIEAYPDDQPVTVLGRDLLRAATLPKVGRLTLTVADGWVKTQPRLMQPQTAPIYDIRERLAQVIEQAKQQQSGGK